MNDVVYCRKCRAQIKQEDTRCPKCGWDQTLYFDHQEASRLAKRAAWSEKKSSTPNEQELETPTEGTPAYFDHQAKRWVFIVGLFIIGPLWIIGYLKDKNTSNRMTEARTASAAVRASVARERPRQEQLAKQVEMLKVEIVPWTNSQGRTFQTVRTTWRNNGPKPIHWLYARIDVRDRATGQLTEDSRDEKCIYDSGDGSVVQPGEVAGDDRAKTPGVLLHLASSERRSVSAEVTPLFADEKEFSP